MPFMYVLVMVLSFGPADRELVTPPTVSEFSKPRVIQALIALPMPPYTPGELRFVSQGAQPLLHAAVAYEVT